MSETPEEKVARLDQQTKDMAEDISEIKLDIKELKTDLTNFKTDVKVTLAKYGVYIVVGISILQIVINKFILK